MCEVDRPVDPLVVAHGEEHLVLGLVQRPGDGPRLVLHHALLGATGLSLTGRGNTREHCNAGLQKHMDASLLDSSVYGSCSPWDPRPQTPDTWTTTDCTT